MKQTCWPGDDGACLQTQAMKGDYNANAVPLYIHHVCIHKMLVFTSVGINTMINNRHVDC